MNKKELGALIIDGTDDFYRVAKSILKEDADCQDAVQEAVSKAIMNRFPEKRLGNINIQICIRKSCHWKSNIGCRWYCII